MAVVDILASYVQVEDRENVYKELLQEIQPIYSPVYLYVEGEACDSHLCEDFLKFINIQNTFVTR